MTERYPRPRALLEKYGLRAKKSWGQNFLGDEAILDDIARLAVPRPGDLVVELGAGLGHLTARLLARGARVVAVERDRDMAAVLRGELGERIALLEADAARVEYATIARQHATPRPGRGTPSALRLDPRSGPREADRRRGLERPRSPWSGTSPTTSPRPSSSRSSTRSAHVSRAVFLVQREVAERLAAEPGTHAWGILSVLLQREADVSIERIVPPRRVPAAAEGGQRGACARSSGRRADALADPARFRRLVKAGFGQRRKTLGNALKAARLVEPGALARALDAARHRPAAPRRDAHGRRVGRARPRPRTAQA